MLSPKVVAVVAVLASWTACSPTLPPTSVPAQPDPTFVPFKQVLQTYIDQTQPYRKAAAVAAEKVPGKAGTTTAAETSVRTRENDLADALRTKLRPNAKQGDLFTPLVAPAIRHQLENVFASAQRELLLDELAEQAEAPAATTPATTTPAPAINQRLVAPRVPPRLIDTLPPLPKQLEYDFAGRTLLLRDVDADVVVDYLPDAIPALPRNAPAEAPRAPTPGAAKSPLAMPSVR